MVWDANEKGNYAYLTKTASEHGGVDNFIDDIHRIIIIIIVINII